MRFSHQEGSAIPEIQELGDKCCGCSACAAICPVQCIDMVEDATGFRHPVVDTLTCIGCQCCDMICPCENPREQDEALRVCWMQNKSPELLDKTSSGGVFPALAQQVLEKGGRVYGAAFSDDFESVCHQRADCEKDLEKLLCSKYLQSNKSVPLYETVRADLQEGRQVLYSGTACEISGLLGYLDMEHVDRGSLLTMEVVCHGTPSPALWRAWVKQKERAVESPLIAMSFRDKRSGWARYSCSYEYQDGSETSFPHSQDWYMRAFLTDHALRPSCFQCPSKRSCGSDLTVGDFWGFQSLHPETDCSRGISAVVANTERGARALEEVTSSTAMTTGSATFEEVLAGNPALICSASAPEDAPAFLKDVARLGSQLTIDELISKWPFKGSLKHRVRAKLGAIKRRVFGFKRN